MNGTSGISPKSPQAAFPPPDRSGRSVSRSIHIRTTAIGCRKQTSSSRTFFIIVRTYPAGMHSGVTKTEDRGAEDQGAEGPEGQHAEALPGRERQGPHAGGGLDPETRGHRGGLLQVAGQRMEIGRAHV